jgi:hypothetical protein
MGRRRATAGWRIQVGPVLRFGPRQAAGVEGGTTDLRAAEKRMVGQKLKGEQRKKSLGRPARLPEIWAETFHGPKGRKV